MARAVRAARGVVVRVGARVVVVAMAEVEPVVVATAAAGMAVGG